MMESFAEAWVAANTQTPLTEAAAAADHVSFFLHFVLFILIDSLSHFSLCILLCFAILFYSSLSQHYCCTTFSKYYTELSNTN